jgi:hypothetical protein
MHVSARRAAVASILRGVAVWALVGSAGVALAQPPGRVNGVVRDEDDQPIKGATVTAQNVNIGVSYTASTDKKGRFVILGLRPGEWAFIAGSPGFAGVGNRMNVRSASNLNPPLLFVLRRNGPGAGGALEKLAAKDLQSQLESAEKLFTQKKWDESIAAYRSIMSAAEPLAFLNLQIATASVGKGDLPRAQGAYEDLLKVDATNDRAIVGIAEIKQKQGDTAGAVEYLTRASRAEGARREVFQALGELSATAGNTDDAARWFTRATEVDPYWGRPLYRLAQIASDKGDKAAADRFMQRVIAVDPSSPEAAQAKQALGLPSSEMAVSRDC